jgi:anthranilate synthase component 2
MILMIDNYDSFTFNLVHYVEELGAEVHVARNDALTVDEALARQPKGVILSPGPCTPNEAGICLELIKRAPADLPILGVCLGHQAIGQAFGGVVERAREIVHGKVWEIESDGGGVFAGVPARFQATRYHSLAVRRDGLPECLVADAFSADGDIMGLHHKRRPVFGVQFHPESIASEHGKTILANFLRVCGEIA